MRKASIASVLLIVALVMFIGSCHQKAHQQLCIDRNCKLVDPNGNEVSLVDLKVGWLVRWCNNSGGTVKIVSSVPKILGGRSSIRLSAGEMMTYRVGGKAGPFDLKWYCENEDGSDGNGGGPGKTEECTPSPCQDPCENPPCP
jgi:hypothetical protein